MIELEIKDGEVIGALNRLVAGLEDATPAMREIAEFLVQSTKDRFGTGASPDGVTWAPKSETTKAAYRRRGEKVDERPLFGPGSDLSRQIFARADRNSVEWGSTRIYAGTMQFGAAQGQFGAFMGKDKRGRDHFHHIPWGNIPARPFLGISQDDREGILEIVGDYLEGLAGTR